VINPLRIKVDKPSMSTFFFLSLDIVLYPAIKSGADLTKNPIPIMNNPTIKLSISIVCQFFIIVANARLYVVGRGISASYEIFRPNAGDRGERNP
jgi:hypothetical protein